MAFQARADLQNHVIGWLQRGYSSLGDGAGVRFPRSWMAPGECRVREARIGALSPDMRRARELANDLHRAFLPTGPGIFGEHAMPEDILPAGLSEGSTEHLLFVTLTVSVDYMRDAVQLWKASRAAYADPETAYLFKPELVCDVGFKKTKADLQRTSVSRKPSRDARAWFTISETLHRKWEGDPQAFIKNCGWHAPTVLKRLEAGSHAGELGHQPDFPHLRGRKIGPLWVRMLRDNGGIEMTGLEEVDIPVDVHVLRATLCSGALGGRYEGSVDAVFKQVRQVWRDAVRGITRPDGKPMVALDVDQALWTLSRLGCSKRGNGSLRPCSRDCPAAPGCVNGVISISDNRCNVKTVANSK